MARKVSKDKELVASQIKATEAQIESFSLRLSSVYAKALDSVLRKIRKGGESAEAVIDTIAVLNDFENELSKAGLDKDLMRIREIYANQLQNIRQNFEKLGKPSAISSVDRPVIEQMITFDVSKIANKILPYVDDARSSIIRSVLLGEAPDEDILKETLPSRLQSNIETEANTLMQSFYRSVTASKSKELGFNLMIYLGPDDSVTRDFCKDVLDGLLEGFEREVPIYTLEEISQMDNEQDLDVLTSGGGWNCRHQWRPISLEDAIELGYEPEEGDEEDTQEDE